VASIAIGASADFVHRFEDLLGVLLYLFTPWTAINLVDYFWVRKGHYSVREIFNRDGLYGRWNWRGLLAYAVGFAAMIPFFSTGLHTGPIAHLPGGADVSIPVRLPVSTLVCLWTCRDLDAAGELLAVQRADAGLDSGCHPHGTARARHCAAPPALPGLTAGATPVQRGYGRGTDPRCGETRWLGCCTRSHSLHCCSCTPARRLLQRQPRQWWSLRSCRASRR